MERTKFSGKVSTNLKINYLQTPRDKIPKVKWEFLDRQEQFIERHILIGAIVNDGFCQWAFENLKPTTLEADDARRMLGWCFEYYKEYQKAPHKNIQNIYMQKLQDGLDTATGEWIESVLQSLSDEFEESKINFSYLQAQVERWQERQELKTRIEQADALIKNNELDEAMLTLQYEPTTINKNIRNHFMSFSELLTADLKGAETLMSPWLREGETNIIYSKFGVGKSLLTTLITWLLSCENYQVEECELNNWQVKKPVGTLYLDGEIGLADCLRQFKKLQWLGEPLPGIEPVIFSLPDYRREQTGSFDPAKKQTQQEIIKFFKDNPKYKVLVIDSLSTLFSLESENDNSEYHNKVQPFLVELRGHKITQIILDHAGKNGELRGASAKGTVLANLLRLTDHPRKEAGQAWFEVNFAGKQRSAGTANKPFYIKFNDAGAKTTWEVMEKSGSNAQSKYHGIVAAIAQGRTNKEAAKMFGCSEQNISSHYRSKAKKDGYLDKDGKPTMDGYKLAEQYAELGKEPIG